MLDWFSRRRARATIGVQLSATNTQFGVREGLLMRRLSGATGALVLSTALLVGGAGQAIATADTGTRDSTSRAADAGGKSSSRSSTDSGSSGRESRTTLRDVVRSATSSLESHRDRVFGPSREDDRTGSRGTDVVDIDDIDDIDDSTDSEAALALEDVVTDTEPVEADADSETPATAADPAGSEGSEGDDQEPAAVGSGSDPSDVETSGSTETTEDTAGGASSSDGSGSADPYGSASQGRPADEQATAVVPAPTPLVRVFTTMNTVVVSLGNAAVAVPTVVFALPFSQTPISDIIALMETVLTSVTESATAAVRLPSDLAALLGLGVIGTGPGVIGGHSENRVEMGTIGTAPVAGTPAPLPLLPMGPEQVVGNFQSQMKLGAFTPISAGSFATPPQAVPSPLSTRIGEHQSFIDRVFGALLVPLSLWALATGALPGLAGLFVVFGAGIRVGYRHAKAGLAVRVSGLARFAGPGPLGVVRSGSLVSVHQRAVPADGPRVLRWSRFSDQAA